MVRMLDKIKPLLGKVADRAIAERFNVSLGAVHRLRTRLGIKCFQGRGRPREHRPYLPRMRRMRRQGLTLQAIGDHFGFTRERVRQLLE